MLKIVILGTGNNPIKVTLQINVYPLGMEVDTDATASLIPVSTQKYFQTAVLEASDSIFTIYTGEQIATSSR